MVTESEYKFFEFCYERQLIWHKKSVLGMSPPWTEDPILSKYKFCNILRELDRGTKFIIKQVVMNETLTPEDKLFNIVAYRFFNHTSMFSETHFKSLIDYKTFKFEDYEASFDEQNKNKVMLFHKAYIVCGHFPKVNYRRDKKHIQVLLSIDNLAKELRQYGYLDRVLEAPTAKDSWKTLQDIHMVGPFLAYEIFSDLTYCRDFYKWTDDDYMYVGPGALTGLEIIYGDIKRKETEQLCYNLRDMQTEAFKMLYERTRKNWTEVAYRNSYAQYPLISLGNIEAALCEYRKYTNITRAETDPDYNCAKRHYKKD